MKRSEATELVMMLIAAFPQARTNDGTSKVYEQMLIDLDVAPARLAVTALLQTSKFLPSIADIREATQVEVNRVIRARALDRDAKRAHLRPAPGAGTPRPRVVGLHTGQAKIIPMVAEPLPAPREQRRFTAEELDAELAKRGSK